MSIESIRKNLPVDDEGKLVDLLVDEMVLDSVVHFRKGLVFRVGHTVELSAEQEVVINEILTIYEDAGLKVPEVSTLPERLSGRNDLWAMLKYLELRGDLIALDQELMINSEILGNVVAKVIAKLGGQEGLSPSEFKKVIPVSRKHLIPILTYMDRTGVTIRKDSSRFVCPVN
jgi:hypothetical protein